MMVGDEPGDIGGDEAHGVAHRVDHTHQGTSKVVTNICTIREEGHSLKGLPPEN